jgi:hypothetical protein
VTALAENMRRLTISLLCVALVGGAAAGLGACGSTKDNSDVRVAVEQNVRAMLGALEQGRYVAACETFTVRSRFALALASASDRHEAGSPCADVFVMAGALKHLGLQQAGARLRAAAGRAGLTPVLDLSPRAVHQLYRGMAATDISSIGARLTVDQDTALLDGKAVAVYQDGRWQLEVDDVKPLSSVNEDAVLHSSCETTTEPKYGRLCQLLKASKAGVVLTGRQHREFRKLFPLLLRGSNSPILPGGRPLQPPQQ